MKPLFSIVLAATAMVFASCGTSAEEKAKIEAEAHAKMDSILTAADQSTTGITDSAKTTPIEHTH